MRVDNKLFTLNERESGTRLRCGGCIDAGFHIFKHFLNRMHTIDEEVKQPHGFFHQRHKKSLKLISNGRALCLKMYTEPIFSMCKTIVAPKSRMASITNEILLIDFISNRSIYSTMSIHLSRSTALHLIPKFSLSFALFHR